MQGWEGCLLRRHAQPELHVPQLKHRKKLQSTPKTVAFAALTSHLSRDKLSERQRQVLELRSAGMTLAEIGVQLGISSERVRQIEARLKSRARAQKLTHKGATR